MENDTENDIFFHALNYRTASSENAHKMWLELEACINRSVLADRAEIELLSKAVIAMAEDGWLYHGVEGMDDAQKICYEAYLRVKPDVDTSWVQCDT